MIDPYIQSKLKRIFSYRHSTLADDLELHRKFQHLSAKKVLISGASGLLGQKLIPLFTTGGHKILCLVQRQPKKKNEIFWDPEKGIIDVGRLPGIDAVIHLSGENVGEGRWTKNKKQKIMESRVLSTRFLSKTISALEPRPEVFISASATGYYGNCNSEIVTEDTTSGNSFLASVCEQWENAAQPVLERGIRTVL